jgi:hypothetical protein
MMRSLLILFLFISTITFAKMVMFEVDMTGQVVNITGVHVTGDFQNVAGFPFGDWQSNTTLMTLEDSSTNIYSVVVDIPAFAKYEYKFVNGDQFYEAEFVPIESRVGYDFDDNRWIYVDSLSNDTTTTGAILFAGNAPAGLSLVRLLVDLQTQSSVSSSGVHVAGDFQNWNTQKNILYSFVPSMYELIVYVQNGTYEYKFFNGNSTGDAELVPSGCNINGNRSLIITKDTVLSDVCFSSCSPCNITSVHKERESFFNVYPNPSRGDLYITSENISSFNVFTVSGELILSKDVTSSLVSIDRSLLSSGAYYIKAMSNDGAYSIRKVLIQ